MDKLLSQLLPLGSPSASDILYAVNSGGTEEGQRTIQQIINLVPTPPVIRETVIKYQIFTLNAAGTTATLTSGPGSIALTDPGATPLVTITIGNELQLLHITSFLTSLVTKYSKGISNGITHNCIASEPLPTGSPAADGSNCINVNDNPDGWKGVVESITATEFAIRFTKNGAGKDITCEWHGVML